MQVHMDYGRQGLDVQLDDSWDVTLIEASHPPELPDPQAALQQALLHPMDSPPLAELVKPGGRVGIIFSDITRPMPRRQVIQALLAELNRVVPDENITLFNALGTHRANTEAELQEMLGGDILSRLRIVQNDALDQTTQTCLGKTTRGLEIWLNRELLECDLKILTGYIEPHFFAGFSGGGKALMPGMAGLQTVIGNHGVENLSHPGATWGVTHGNPLWEEIHEIALRCGKLFLCNVTLNRQKKITGVFAGGLHAAHAAGCGFVRRTAMVPIQEPFDIVLTSNSGYPLDLNLYQSVKGISAAAQAVRPGGAILIVTECWDGIPEHGSYRRLASMVKSPQAMLDLIRQPGFQEHDQWQLQVQAQIQLKAQVFVHSALLTDDQISAVLYTPAPSLEETLYMLVERYGKRARLAVLPDGPLTVPYFAR